MSEKLTVIYKPMGKHHRFDAGLGCLFMDKAGPFYVTIKEYEDEIKRIDHEIDNWQKAINKAYNHYSIIFDEKAKDGWTEAERLSEKANDKVYLENKKKIEQKIDALRNEKARLPNKYSDVQWCWQLVGNSIKPSDLYCNEYFGRGISGETKKFDFTALIEGGGMAWVEAFRKDDPPTGEIPHGFFVQAKGAPQIIRTAWTDGDFNPITNSVKFGSTVLLHIYTNAMYGQDLSVDLIDHDIFSPNDDLTEESNSLKTEVNVYKIMPHDGGEKGIAGYLGKEMKGAVVTRELDQFIQKAVVTVPISYSWLAKGGNFLSGHALNVYPMIKSWETNTYFEWAKENRPYLEVHGVTVQMPQIERANNPVLVGQVATNVAMFQPCHYSKLILTDYNDSKTEIYKEDPTTKDVPNLEIGIIGFTNPKKYSIQTDVDSTVHDCRQKRLGKPPHTQIFTQDAHAGKGLTNVHVEFNEVDFVASFPYDEVNLFDFFWLSESKKNLVPLLPIKAATCRHQHDISVRLYPDITWELNFFYNTTDPVWYGQSSPVYNMYPAEETAVRDNTKVSDVKTVADLKALAALKAEENNTNKATANAGKMMAPGINRSLGDTLSNFGLSAKVSWDQAKSQELSFKIAEKYRQLLGTLKSIYDLAERITGAKDAREQADNLPANLAYRRNLMSLSLLPPAPSVGVSWKYAMSKTGTMGVELKGKLKCAPLIGGELKIDLIALSEKIPVYGNLIRALDLATWLAEKISLNSLSINYRIDLTFYANLALDEAYISYNDAQPEGGKLQTDMTVSGTFGGKLEMSIEVKNQIKQKIKKDPIITFEAGLKGECYFKITASPNANADNIIDWTTKFSGLIITGYFKVGVKTSRDKSERSGEMDPFKLIPAFTGTPISMVLGEGKTHKY
jgi:hypothetical protein